MHAAAQRPAHTAIALLLQLIGEGSDQEIATARRHHDRARRYCGRLQDRQTLTRSLADFAKIVEILDARSASFVSVTQQFNTTSSMGRLTLNVLLSFAQFEREVIGERIRDICSTPLISLN